MTDIPVEKKTDGMLWVWLILGAIVIARLIWFLADHRQSTFPPMQAEGALGSVSDNSVFAEPAPDATVTNPAILLNGSADMDVEPSVKLTPMPPPDVPADADFGVVRDDAKARPENEFLHEVRTPDTAIAGKIGARPGDRSDIVGAVPAATDGVPEDTVVLGPTVPLPPGGEIVPTPSP